MTHDSQKQKWMIYCHTTPSNKKYIGMTSRSPEKRWANGRGYINCPSFYRAIQKYGWDNISHEVLVDNLNFDEAVKYEKYYISLYKSNNPDYGYNLTSGGIGTDGYKASSDMRQLLSQQRQGINACAYGHFPSEETKNKMRVSALNKEFTPETKEKMSMQKQKTVYQYNLFGNLLNIFSSAKQASIETRTNHGNLCACCRNIVKTANGYFWSYSLIEDPNLIINHLNGVEVFSPIYTKNEKSVYKMDHEENILCKYNSIKEASLDTNISGQEISHACKNPKAVTREFKWKYAD